MSTQVLLVQEHVSAQPHPLAAAMRLVLAPYLLLRTLRLVLQQTPQQDDADLTSGLVQTPIRTRNLSHLASLFVNIKERKRYAFRTSIAVNHALRAPREVGGHVAPRSHFKAGVVGTMHQHARTLLQVSLCLVDGPLPGASVRA